jgi:hypothetical protein
MVDPVASPLEEMIVEEPEARQILPCRTTQKQLLF